MGIPAVQDQPQGRSEATAVMLVEISRSERALRDLLHRAERLHRSNLAHAASSCLLCFEQA